MRGIEDSWSKHLLGCLSEIMFHQHGMRLSSTTFKYLCQVLTRAISRTYINMRACILVEIKVAITLSRLGSGNVLLACSEIYGWPLVQLLLLLKSVVQ
jgi:hypothetical protein